MITEYEFAEKLYSEKKDVHSRFKEAEEKGLAKNVEYKVTKDGKRYVTYNPGDVNLTKIMEKTYSTGDETLDELLERAFCEGYEYAQREYSHETLKGLGLSLAAMAFPMINGTRIKARAAENPNVKTRIEQKAPVSTIASNKKQLDFNRERARLQYNRPINQKLI